MNKDTIFIFWFVGVFCATILPWTIDGIIDFLEQIPASVDVKEKRKSNFWCKLLQHQVSPIFLVPLGIMSLSANDIFGLKINLSWYFYLIAPIFGVFVLVLTTGFTKSLAFLMGKCCPKLLESDLARYQYNMKRRITKLSSFKKIVLSLTNGFGEEFLMRLLIIGGLSYYYSLPIWISIVFSLLLSGIHHSYQGRIFGLIGAAFAHLPYAIAYILTKDFLFIALSHVAIDLAGTFVVPIIMKQKTS